MMENLSSSQYLVIYYLTYFCSGQKLLHLYTTQHHHTTTNILHVQTSPHHAESHGLCEEAAQQRLDTYLNPVSYYTHKKSVELERASWCFKVNGTDLNYMHTVVKGFPFLCYWIAGGKQKTERKETGILNSGFISFWNSATDLNSGNWKTSNLYRLNYAI
jgi:hypothetical protein